jgi:hypothetical protein
VFLRLSVLSGVARYLLNAVDANALLCLMLGLAAACSSADPSPASSSPSSPPASVGEDGTDEPLKSTASKDDACNALAQEATKNVLTRVALAAPTGTGGALVDGKYVLTGYRRYTGARGSEGPTADSLRETLVITGSVVQTLQETSNGSSFRASFSQSTTGTSFTHKETCPGTLQGGKGSYTASADKISFFDVLFGETTEREFTRQ